CKPERLSWLGQMTDSITTGRLVDPSLRGLATPPADGFSGNWTMGLARRASTAGEQVGRQLAARAEGLSGAAYSFLARQTKYEIRTVPRGATSGVPAVHRPSCSRSELLPQLYHRGEWPANWARRTARSPGVEPLIRREPLDGRRRRVR